MKIIIISSQLPMPDRASGDLRFFTILKVLAKNNDITIATYSSEHQKVTLGDEAYKTYINQLENLSITVSTNCIDIIRESQFDVVWFEFYDSTDGLIDLVRFHHPNAYIIIDSVDVHFNRLEAKAKLTQLKEDFILAENIKKEELQAYKNADMVIAVTEADKKLISETCPEIKISVIPNIHNIPDFIVKVPGKKINLLFVGYFKHSPNVDAVCFFCTEVMPLLRNKYPDIHLNIVGSSPSQEVLDLAKNDITIFGYVPDLVPYYRNADIVIAPLRYGGGMKGKVGEALSFSTPIVTTDFGAEGFGIKPDIHYLLANKPDEFVNEILKLINDNEAYKRISENGWQFIKDNYSYNAIETVINNTINNLYTLKTKKLSFSKWVYLSIKRFINRNILWRLSISSNA
ncbi:glycosyltransferase family 4 protein [Methylicorpusculum oleiharenae]|uniref:glycosyltransferase family 4 protein n=1 Tax=Methylicorpusculum oleiharenae TaxID=1338687 RepID=UPI001359EF6C|nr:glycosyltransferase family 4 protein [Methylicorpusculum oleiharenae]MCD2451816.1 glycosyltransferase family 4 protein [Methylicorpusculum oleiharenae]